MRVHVLLTVEGTACSETALCASHFTPARREQFEREAAHTPEDYRPYVAGGWHEVENDMCHCVECMDG